MKLFPNAHNNRILVRFAACLAAGAVVQGVVGLALPHFPDWQASGAAAILLLLALFVVPYSLRQPPSSR